MAGSSGSGQVAGLSGIARAGPGPRTEVLRRTRPPRVETLGYDWEEVIRRGAPVLESGLRWVERRVQPWSQLWSGLSGRGGRAPL